VRFDQTEVWPAYTGADSDTIDIEIFQHWLEPAPEA
jgi:nitrile hydratase